MKPEEWTPLMDGDILEYIGTFDYGSIPRFSVRAKNFDFILHRLDKEQENQTYPNKYWSWMSDYKLIRKSAKPFQEILDECLDI